jgi:hypothetical protein
MSFSPLSAPCVGQIVNDLGNFFDVAPREANDLPGWAADCAHRIYVGNAGETRLARILKTVAYVVIDEDANGAPVYEKWPLRSSRFYAGA